MKLHAEKTGRGWELADESGTFEAESLSVAYPSKKAAAQAALEANAPCRYHDESKSAISGDNF